MEGRQSDASGRLAGGRRGSAGQCLGVHRTPSLWYENMFSVEASDSLEPRYYATWALPEQLDLQSARSEGRNPGRTQPEGEPASSCSLHCLVSWRHLVVTARRRVQLHSGRPGKQATCSVPPSHPEGMLSLLILEALSTLNIHFSP